MTGAIHESFARDDQVKGSSDRSFGLVFAVVFGLVGTYHLWHGSLWTGGAAIVGALLLLAVALVRPAWLAWPNRLWFRFGLLLHRVVNPLVMGLLFYGCVLPIGLALRLAKYDPLRRKFDAAVPSYWIHRQPPGPDPRSLANQF